MAAIMRVLDLPEVGNPVQDLFNGPIADGSLAAGGYPPVRRGRSSER